MKKIILSIICVLLCLQLSQAQNTRATALFVGTKGTSFTYTNTLNTALYTNDYAGRPANDVFYKLTLTRQMTVTISHCGSEVSDTYLHLLNSTGTRIAYNDDYSGEGKCDKTTHSYLKTKLSPGIYYVVSEGYSANGNITTTIEGDVIPHFINAGSYNESFTYTNTFWQYELDNTYGSSGLDEYHKFTLTKPMNVKLTHCNSGTCGTNMYLLNEIGNEIDNSNNYRLQPKCSDNENHAGIELFLEAGTYYVVSESTCGSSGNIILNMEGKQLTRETSSTPSAEKYHMLSIVPTVPASSTDGLTNKNSLQSVTYFDEFGMPVQQVQTGVTPYGEDLITHTEFDIFGRVNRQWLPAEFSGNNGGYFSGDFGQAAATANGGAPYTTMLYERSGLNREKGQSNPGTEFAGHPTQINYGTNNASEVPYYYVNSRGNVVRNTNLRFYAADSLFKTDMLDEDGKLTVRKYTNKLGQVVHERDGAGNKVNYVYNNAGNLCYVLLHDLSYTEHTETSTQLTQDYLYRYDDQGRMIRKRLPGCDWVDMVYDQAGRLIMQQDGNQRTRGEWTYYKYDVLGRPVFTGLGTTIYSAEALRNDYANKVMRDIPTGNGFGYTNNFSLFVSQKQLLTVNYYDDYSFLNLHADPVKSKLAYEAKPGYGALYENAKGLPTGSRTYALDGSGYTVTATYYDYRGRVIQTRATNHLGGYDIVYNQYDFSGNVTQTLKEHSTNTQHSSPLSELYINTYDHAGRLLETTLNGTSLAKNKYDAHSRVTEKKQHGGVNTVNYQYNLRNWITQIQDNDFTQKLYYAGNPFGAQECYNGNISGSEIVMNNKKLLSKYTYDGNNRLTDVSSPNGGNYGMWEKFKYAGRNISQITRYNGDYAVDNMTMTYDAHNLKLINIYDEQDNNVSYDMKEYQDLNQSYENDFAYDANGNMTKDLDREITTIRYNLLNLPDTVQFRRGHQIINTYDAAGRKLQTKYVTCQSTVYVPVGTTLNYPGALLNNSTTIYGGNVEYEVNNSGTRTLKRIHNSDGYIDTDGKYHYYRRDHLGNNVGVWYANNGTATTIQRTLYYPSGLPFIMEGASEQPYKFGGKEFVEMHGYNIYDFEARGYYPGIMMFTTMDPHAEKYYNWSPYMYCYNNPTKFIDPDGQDPGDPFNSPDEAAEDWGEYYNGESISEGKEFGSTIYLDREKGKKVYKYTEAAIGNEYTVKESPAPKNHKRVATIHSHGKYIAIYDNNNFSRKQSEDEKNQDIEIAESRNLDMYLTTPSGTLQKYDVKTKEITILRTDLVSDPKDPESKNYKPATK